MDLEAFLHAQQARGFLDSQGSFTVNVEKAREKLGKFALAHPGFYLLKVIQAGVAMGSSQLRITTTQRGLGLWFAPARTYDFAHFQAAVANPAQTVAAPLRLLAEGFNASLWSGLESACVIAWSRDGGRGLFLDGDGLVSGNSPPRPDDLPAVDHLWMFSLSKSASGWSKSQVEDEIAAVRERCPYLPLELTLDEQTLPRRPSRRGWLVERLDVANDGGLRLCLPQQSQRRIGESGWLSTGPGETFCLQPPIYVPGLSVRCRAAYFLPLDLAGEDRIIFVRHGVIVASHPLGSLGAGALAIVEAGDLEVDISGFGLVRDENLKRKIEDVRYVWREMAHSVNGPDLDGLPAGRAMPGLLPSAVTAGLSALLLPAASSPLTLMAAVGVLAAAYKLTSRVRQDDLLALRRRQHTRRRLTEVLARQWPWSKPP